jgi:hypothetical protein
MLNHYHDGLMRVLSGELSMKVRVLLLLTMVSFGLQAADCTNAGIQPSTDESVDFDVATEGVVTDKSTGLMWMRCSAGQTWARATASCTGTALKIGWDQILVVNNFNAAGGFAGKKDWRLPNINELRSIVEDCRSDPAINTVLFPDTPSIKYWTASSYIGLATNAWVVDFAQGRDNFELKSNANAVRLVRVAD